MSAQFRISSGTVDLDRRTIAKGDAVQRLSTKEAAVFRVLAASPGVAVTKETLLNEVWGSKAHPGNTVGEVVHRLRKKVEAHVGQPEHILTVHGEGFVFVPLSGAEPRLNDPVWTAEVALPQESELFFGRGEELRRVEEALAQPGTLVSIIGPGGVGKTTLAIRVAHRWRNASAARAFFVPGAQVRQRGDLGHTIGCSLGREGAIVPAELIHCVGPGDLVVFDNAEHLAEAVVDWVRETKGVRWLVTSREPLRLPKEQCVRLSGLSAAEGVKLFGEIARRKASSVELDPEVVAQIVAKLDFEPLAIEMAAGRVRSRSLAVILDMLNAPLGLKSRDRREARHSSIRAVLSWSWELLEAGEQEALSRLCMLRSAVDFAIAARWVGDERVDALLDKSWLRRQGGDRLSIPSAVAAFVLEQQSSQTRAQRAIEHAEFFASMCREAGMRRIDGTVRPQRSVEADVWAALDHIGSDNNRIALACSLRHMPGGAHRVVEALSVETPQASPEFSAWRLCVLGDCEEERLREEEAIAAYSGVAACLPEEHPLALTARASLLGAQLKADHRALDEVEPLLRALMEPLATVWGIRACRALSFGLRWRGQEARAERLLRKACACAGGVVAPDVEAALCADLADIRLQVQAFEEAGDLFRQAAKLFADCSPKRQAWCNANLGVVRLEQGRYDEAEVLLRVSRRVLQGMGAEIHVGIHSLNLATLHMLRGEHDDAIVEAHRAARSLKGAPEVEAAPVAIEAAALAGLGEIREARAQADRACAMQGGETAGVRQVVSACVDVLVAAARGQGLPEDLPDVSEVRLAARAAAAALKSAAVRRGMGEPG